ncbi:Protein of unknown function [Pyronema omphalodes CBS 100304]|uniref:Uncharacterized protein n=1 Tax=Pyronema omphalodes (strain CBS 100304) TaxID=1076935 RepID=U4L9S6_PYROM|nr:Protein of unknown function [Pyronema omphalodes CBS 100304]
MNMLRHYTTLASPTSRIHYSGCDHGLHHRASLVRSVERGFP